MGLLLLLTAACTPDQGFVEQDYDAIAVVAGDFDAVESNLDRLLVPFQLYEGFISGPSYDIAEDIDNISLSAETLFLNETDQGREIFLFDVVFVNSGTRGFGEVVYNGLDPDDALVTDPDVLTNVREYVESGGVLVVSDWAYELVEAIWPEKIEFFGDDALLDEAQAGSVGRYTASVASDDLADALGPSASVDYNFSYWTVIESVSGDVDVHLTGDIEYRISGSEGEGSLSGVPLLLSFTEGKGLVVFSSFHWNAQVADLADTLLTTLVAGLPIDGAEDTGV